MIIQPSVSSSRSRQLSFHTFIFWLPHSSHTFASLVSRTLATRTVMSSMRSWILQLWPPLPAHEALLTLALGTLSSMQPSSLAHTSACHYRPFPSDFGLKVHSDALHPFVHTPFTCTDLPLYAPHGSLVYLSLQPWSYPSLLLFRTFDWSRVIFRLLFNTIALKQRCVVFFGKTEIQRNRNWKAHYSERS